MSSYKGMGWAEEKVGIGKNKTEKERKIWIEWGKEIGRFHFCPEQRQVALIVYAHNINFYLNKYFSYTIADMFFQFQNYFLELFPLKIILLTFGEKRGSFFFFLSCVSLISCIERALACYTFWYSYSFVFVLFCFFFFLKIIKT